MFKLLRATAKGRKVAVECQRIHKDFINSMIAAGGEPRLLHTSAFLREFYAFCNIMAMVSWMNDLQRGQMFTLSKDILSDYLRNAFNGSLDYYDFHSEASDLTDEFIPYLHSWLNDLVQINPDLHGKDDFLPVAIEKVFTNIESIYAEELGIPSNALCQLLKERLEEAAIALM